MMTSPGPGWTLVPGRTVLINIDDQNDLLHPDGATSKSGIDISHMQRVIDPTHALVAECRRAGIPIVWTSHGYRSVDEMGPLLDMRPLYRDGGLRLGTWGYEILADMDIRPEDIHVSKSRFSAFFQTDLEIILRDLCAETVLLTGVLTNQCVSTTCTDALFRDFKPIVVEECTGTAMTHLHEPAIEMIRCGWGQVNLLNDTLREIRQMPAAAVPPNGAASSSR